MQWKDDCLENDSFRTWQTTFFVWRRRWQSGVEGGASGGGAKRRGKSSMDGGIATRRRRALLSGRRPDTRNTMSCRTRESVSRPLCCGISWGKGSRVSTFLSDPFATKHHYSPWFGFDNEKPPALFREWTWKRKVPTRVFFEHASNKSARHFPNENLNKNTRRQHGKCFFFLQILLKVLSVLGFRKVLRETESMSFSEVLEDVSLSNFMRTELNWVLETFWKHAVFRNKEQHPHCKGKCVRKSNVLRRAMGIGHCIC